jgi:hypothetical protein
MVEKKERKKTRNEGCDRMYQAACLNKRSSLARLAPKPVSQHPEYENRRYVPLPSDCTWVIHGNGGPVCSALRQQIARSTKILSYNVPQHLRRDKPSCLSHNIAACIKTDRENRSEQNAEIQLCVHHWVSGTT